MHQESLMMKVKQMNDNFDHIRKAMLPIGCDFFEDQKKALLAKGNFNIIAGPGSGKTTVLTAKLASLLLNRKETDKAICLVTHTNVAVEEVFSGLNKVGIKKVEYPNFIGTIQEFFNHFFAIKAFNSLNKGSNIRILDDDEYTKKLEPIFRSKVTWYSKGYSVPGFKKNQVSLNIDNDNNVFFLSQANKSYRDSYNQSFQTLFQRGMVTNQQCLELAKWYIENNLDKIKSAFSSRFNYLLLDEAQDTSIMQYSLLEGLTDTSEVNFQKFGDPYQALYSIYGDGNIDAWRPYNETQKGFQIEEIAETSRFGSTIAAIVKDTCIEPYENFRSVGVVNSFNPNLIIFNSKEELLEKYKKTIEHYENESYSFKECKRKDVIVSDMHDNLTRYFPEYSKEKNKILRHEYSYKQIYDYIVTTISSIYGNDRNDLRLVLSENLDNKILISKMIKELNSQDGSIDVVKQILRFIVKEKLTDAQLSEIIMSMINTVKETKKGIISGNENDTFYTLNTIHGVKGETHRSTMLIIDSFLGFNNDHHENKYFERIKPFLIGQRIDYNGSKNEEEFKKALKLTFVALSRPSYLAIIAIPQKNMDDAYKEQLIAHHWREIVN